MAKTPDFSKVGDFLEKNSKPILYIGVAVVAFFLLKKLIANWKGSITDPANMDCDALKRSVSADEIIMITEGIYDAMNRIGTNEQAIIDLITPLNSEDLKCVVKAFGLRRYDPIFGTGSLVIGATKSLQGWLKSELSGYWLGIIQALFTERNIPF